MEFKLPKAEETQVSIVFDENESPVVIDLLDLDDAHTDAVSLAQKTNKPFYEMFDALFQERYGKPIKKTQAYLLLKHKEQRFEELKKNCSLLPSLSNSMDTQED